MRVKLSKKQVRELYVLKSVIRRARGLPKSFKRKCKTIQGIVDTIFLSSINLDLEIWRYDEKGREKRYLDRKAKIKKKKK